MEVDASALPSNLSEFQVQKFKFLFDILFQNVENSDDEIDETDVENAIEKMRLYAGWPLDSKQYSQLRDFGQTFYECAKECVKAEHLAEETSEEDAKVSWDEAFRRNTEVDTSKMNFKQWINMWGKLCYGAAGIRDFPIWVQILPHILFRIMDKACNGVVSFGEFKEFYANFVGIASDDLDRVAKEGYRALTANGDYVLNSGNYMYNFSNFLLGKTIYGPGKYVFGVFDNRELDEPFSITYAPTE